MSFPNLSFWWHLLATLGIEVCCLAALGFGAQRFFRSAVWQRAVWRMTVICLLVLAASEWTGFGRGAAGHLFGQKQAMAIAPAVNTMITLPAGNRPMAAILNLQLAAPSPAVWWPGWVWLAGAVMVLGRMGAAQVLLLTLRARRERIASGPLMERVDYVASCVGLRRKVNLLRVPESISPMAFGLLRPSIGLPPGFEARYSASEQDAVLAHELAHLAARDPMWFFMADLATALLWWHPLAWWVRRSLHVSAELAADEATALVPDGPGALAKCLVSLGKELTAARGWGWIGMKGGFRSKLGMRVERLLRMSNDGKRPLPGWMGGMVRIAVAILVLPSILLLFGALQSAHGQKEESWPEEFLSSWKDSPGGLLLLAARNDKEKPKASAAARVQEAKTLYEQGKLKEAEAILDRVPKDDPSNRTARYYLDLIHVARSVTQATQIPSVIAPQFTPNPLDFGPQSMPIPLTWTEQPMLIPLDPTASLSYVQASPVFATASSNIGAQIATQLPSPLFDAFPLLASSDGFNSALGGPVPIEGPPPTEPLYSRVFRVDATTFLQNLKKEYETHISPGSATEGSTNHLLMARAYFTAAGVTLTEPGKSVFLNDRTGLLYVRATEEDFKIIRQAIQELDASPPQLVIESKFIELSQEECRTLGFSFHPDNTMVNNGAAGFRFEPLPIVGAGSTSGLRNVQETPSAAAMNGVMSDAELRITMNILQQRTGRHILAAPKVTTLSGRQAHIESSHVDRSIMLDVLATVTPDGYAIRTTAIAIVKTETENCAVGISHTVWDSQTLVFGRMMTSQKPGAEKVLLVFVTPTIIDPAGNRVHADDELPFANSSVPGQQAP